MAEGPRTNAGLRATVWGLGRRTWEAAAFLRELAVRSVKEFMDDHCTIMAAAISYYVMFSLFPLLIFAAGVAGLVLQAEEVQDRLVNAVMDVVPLSQDEGRQALEDAIRGAAKPASGGLGALGLVGMAWSGSNLFGVLRRTLNIAFDVEESRPLPMQKLVDLAMMVGLGLLFMASIAATTFFRVAAKEGPHIAVVGDVVEAMGVLWHVAGFVLPALVTFLALWLLYVVMPNVRLHPRDVWPGALVGAVGFEVAKVGFGLYLENFANFDAVFGSLGAVAIFLFWVYVSAIILLFGAEVASECWRLRHGHAPGAPMT